MMQVALEVLGNLKRRLKISLPPEQVTPEYERRLKQAGANTRMPGFRPGKIPLRVLKQHFGADIRKELSAQLISETLVEALTAHDLRPVAYPSIMTENQGIEQGLSYQAEFEVFPKIDLPNWPTMTVKRPVMVIEEEDIDRLLERLGQEPIDHVADHQDLKAIVAADEASRRELARQWLANHLTQWSYLRLRAAFIDVVSAQVKCFLPQAFIDAEIHRLRQLAEDQTRSQPLSPQFLQDQARQQVSWMLMVHEIAARQEMVPDEQAVTEILEKMAAQANDPAVRVDVLQQNPVLMFQVATHVLERPVIDWLQGQVALVDEPLRWPVAGQATV